MLRGVGIDSEGWLKDVLHPEMLKLQWRKRGVIVKGIRTKAQEVVNELWGIGRYRVQEEDIPKLALHLRRILSELLEEKYVDVIVDYVSGEDIDNYRRQLKHHAVQNVRKVIGFFPDFRPDFLEKVILHDGRTWKKAELAEVLYGERGDPKVYIIELPEPKDGVAYTKSEVEAILTTL